MKVLLFFLIMNISVSTAFSQCEYSVYAIKSVDGDSSHYALVDVDGQLTRLEKMKDLPATALNKDHTLQQVHIIVNEAVLQDPELNIAQHSLKLNQIIDIPEAQESHLVIPAFPENSKLLPVNAKVDGIYAKGPLVHGEIQFDIDSDGDGEVDFVLRDYCYLPLCQNDYSVWELQKRNIQTGKWELCSVIRPL